MEVTELEQRWAWEAREQAYAPYSGYRVGAVLVAADGRRFTGANIENAAYGDSICAERVALFKAVSEGVRAFDSLTVVAEGSEPVPCGSCRQVLSEFAPDLPIRVATREGGREFTLRELLPHHFTLGAQGGDP